MQITHATLQRGARSEAVRRGIDSRCSITADLIDGPRLFVDATAAWPFAAITHAASRLSEVIRRMHKRQAAHRGGAAATHRIEIQ
jgi:ribosome-associated translation inhibitor RaiA